MTDAVAAEVQHDMPDVDLDLRLDAVNQALAQIRQRDAGLRGRLGERSARITQAKVRIPAASGKAAFRIPDAGRITRLDIGGFTSLAMRAVIRRAVEESLGRRSEPGPPPTDGQASGA